MSSYLGPVQAVQTLPPTIIYQDSTYPLYKQLDEIYTQIADVVNNKATRNTYNTNLLPTNDIWVDGRTIYVKTIATGTLTQGATNNIAHGITNFRTLVDIRLVVTNGTTQKILPYASPTAANSASVDVNATNIVVVAGATFGVGFSGYAIIEFTVT